MKEKSDFANWLLSVANKYQPMGIYEYFNEVEPYESMELFCNSIEQAVSETEIDPKNLETLINIFKYGKLQLSIPQHDKSKTKVKNKIKVEFIQSLIEKLESHKEMKNNISTQPKSIQCIDGIKLEDLKFIFNKLMGARRLDKSVTEINFVATFQPGALPGGWKQIKWLGSNPELATLVNQLTGLKPLPSLVNQYFKPAKIFDSQKTKDINNKLIINLVAGALK